MHEIPQSHEMPGEAKDALVLFMPSGRRGRFALGTPVLEAARRLGVYIESVCGGRAICGRCQVSVAEGIFAKHGITSTRDNLSPFSETEKRYTRVRTMDADRRLSCSSMIMGDLVIDVPNDVQVNRQIVRKGADDKVITREPATHLMYVEVEEPDMEKPLGDADRLPLTGNVLATYGMLEEEGGIPNADLGFGENSARIVEFDDEVPGLPAVDLRIRSDVADRPEGWHVYRARKIARPFDSQSGPSPPKAG